VISITEDRFKQLFPARVWYAWDLLTGVPKTEQELLFTYLPSKLWRLNNLYYIINKDGEQVKFHMNSSQFYVYSRALLHPRVIVLKSRQQGISTLWLISFIDDVLFLENITSGLMAQDKTAASKLLERVKYTWDNIDVDIKSFLKRSLVKNNTEEFKFNNHSSILVNTSFRSATLQRLHISELGKIANKYPEKAKETKTGALQTIAPGNTVIIESTAEGANMFKRMWDSAVSQEQKGRIAAKDFIPAFLSWTQDPDCIESEKQVISSDASSYFSRVESMLHITLSPEQKNFWVAQERELEGEIFQEYPATPEDAFAAAKDGTYWSRRYIQDVLIKGHKSKKLYDLNLPVYVAFDIGRNDYMVAIFFQFFQNEIRIVGEYYNSGEDIKHYADKLLEREKLGWRLREIALPHDAEAIVLGANGKSRRDQFHEAGISQTVILDKEDRGVGIDEVRHAMADIYIDDDCVYIESCMLNYSKEWNLLLNIFRNEPRKDEYCHGADAVRYMVQYCIRYLGYKRKKIAMPQEKEIIQKRQARISL